MVTTEDERTSKYPRKVVLLVDDDPAVGEALSFALSDRYDVIVAHDANAAITSMSDDVSAVVLDIKMQGRDGFWTCEQIQRTHPHTPIIFHSAYQDLKDPYEVINQHRPFAYIVKGHPEELFNAIHRAVRLHDRLLDNQAVLERLALIQERMRGFRK